MITEFEIEVYEQQNKNIIRPLLSTAPGSLMALKLKIQITSVEAKKLKKFRTVLK